MVALTSEVAMRTSVYLFMSNEGEIQCEAHAPTRGSCRWCRGEWQPMSVSERASFKAELDRAASCETCDSIARRAQQVAS